MTLAPATPVTRLRGLYAVTPDALCQHPARLAEAAEAALAGGARLLQYRDKRTAAPERARIAASLLNLCRRYEALLIINDDVELAGDLGADGVHLGAGDLPVLDARRRLGPRALIGVSCANRLDRAVAAQAAGASYVAFGRFFPSRTKPQAPQAPVSLLVEARQALEIPLCAIGGVLPENAGALISAGAGLVAAVEGVFGAADVRAAACAYAALFVQ